MDFILEKMETKVEFFAAYDLKKLEQDIAERIDINKALLLDVHAVHHQVTFDPNSNKMLYTATVHFKVK